MAKKTVTTHKTAEKKTRKQELQELQLAILKQMVTLTSSGFGLVAALAWNNVIQDLVNSHIKPYLPQGSSLLSLFIYAILITVVAVLVTYNLTKIVQRLEQFGKSEE